MRYILGCKVINKQTKEEKDCFCIAGAFSLYPRLYTLENLKTLFEDKEIEMLIFENLEDVQKAISKYSVAFRRNDKGAKSQKWEKSNYIKKFYALKFDSTKCPIKIKEKVEHRKLNNLYSIDIKERFML